MVIAPPLPLSDRPEFGPPPNARSWRALALAVGAHLLLVVALTWGVNWKNSDEAAAFSAELWTGQAPPQSPTSPEQPAPQPVPRPAPAPPPQPAQPPPTPAPAPPPPKVEAPPPDVDIAIEQAKKRALLRKQQAAEDREEQKAADLAAKKQAKLQEEKVRLKAEQAADKAQAIKLKTQEAAKEAAKETVREAAREAARDAKDAKDAKNAKDAQRKQELQKQAATAAAKGQRDANLARLNAQLGSTGATGGSPKGTAAQGNGGSTTYGAIVKAAIKPNVVFGDDITGNPMAKVEVRLTLDGTIISQRLIASSGNKAWDDAAMNGITRTRVMPRDVDGRIPDTTLILEMRPKN